MQLMAGARPRLSANSLSPKCPFTAPSTRWDEFLLNPTWTGVTHTQPAHGSYRLCHHQPPNLSVHCQVSTDCFSCQKPSSASAFAWLTPTHPSKPNSHGASSRQFSLTISPVGWETMACGPAASGLLLLCDLYLSIYLSIYHLSIYLKHGFENEIHT